MLEYTLVSICYVKSRHYLDGRKPEDVVIIFFSNLHVVLNTKSNKSIQKRRISTQKINNKR